MPRGHGMQGAWGSCAGMDPGLQLLLLPWGVGVWLGGGFLAWAGGFEAGCLW